MQIHHNQGVGALSQFKILETTKKNILHELLDYNDCTLDEAVMIKNAFDIHLQNKI